MTCTQCGQPVNTGVSHAHRGRSPKTTDDGKHGHRWSRGLRLTLALVVVEAVLVIEIATEIGMKLSGIA
ncbi:hypothetical protein BX265_8315 [Streptomyces sp. TLI_235]|nr:hypothetical protein [Streptomyces sp. TLI_235]PBC66257.1 hypothetical protein BX265_8315 [Streptomyces sp. TLI_235]